NQLDHLGIVIVIWGSAIPSDYFGFYCDQNLRIFYWSMATFATISCGIFTMRSVFRTLNYRPFRSAMYSVLGLSIFIPAIHGVLLHEWALQNERISLTYFIGLGILNGTGTAIYTARIPERWYARRFDIYGSSHQIMHVLLLCGTFSHTIGLVKAFAYWQGLRAMEGGACARIRNPER
ncbi:adipor-like receptor, partial [Stipitochalara longipes BDJ]